jgi:hypothetical protein
VRCARCRHVLTTERERLEVSGRHAHTFMNPSGVIFEIGCYRTADGARLEGMPEKETSWFPGTAWVYAHCAACHGQVGWSYVYLEEHEPQRFFGLMLDAILA